MYNTSYKFKTEITNTQEITFLAQAQPAFMINQSKTNTQQPITQYPNKIHFFLTITPFKP